MNKEKINRLKNEINKKFSRPNKLKFSIRGMTIIYTRMAEKTSPILIKLLYFLFSDKSNTSVGIFQKIIITILDEIQNQEYSRKTKIFLGVSEKLKSPQRNINTNAMRVENKIKANFVGKFFSINSKSLAKDRPPTPPIINANGRYLGSINRRNSALTNTKKKGI